MKHILSWLWNRRDYLLTDGMQSCAYLPRRLYRRLMKRLERSLRDDPKAENSLRFVWTRCGDAYLLLVNPKREFVALNCTHGLARDSGGRVFIACPYLQQIYWRLGVAPMSCGRIALVEQKGMTDVLCAFRLRLIFFD